LPLNSMTGFADARGLHNGLRWRWEAKSVNGRGLDLRFRIPPGFEGLEPGARTLAAERFKRGSLQVVLTVASEETTRGFRVDPVALADAIRLAKRIQEDAGLAPASVDGLLGLRGVIIQEENLALNDEARMARDAALLESLADALDRLLKARSDEGAKLQSLLLNRIDEVERLTASAREYCARQPQTIRDRLLAQVKDLLPPGASLSEERLAQEVALLWAHSHEARALIAAGDAAGRKLDFLAQEFNREANTLCSKASDIQLTHIGLALKAVIDQFREQVQNVE
jgi:uncharacterized protein (TIGR00255 family)